MLLAPGARLGAYEILAPIGAGGMGEVYKARDSRLHRLSALKILPRDKVADPDRRARFVREVVYWFTSRAKPIDSLAVMPFVNVGGDPNTEYLSDGITESLINNLSQLPKLRVAPRSLVIGYKGRDMDPRKVGQDLRVRAILTGKVVQRGDGLHIQTDLVDVAEVSQLWGQQYDSKFAQIMGVQEDIAKQVSEKLRLRTTGEEQKRMSKRATENTEAYQLYMTSIRTMRRRGIGMGRICTRRDVWRRWLRGPARAGRGAVFADYRRDAGLDLFTARRYDQAVEELRKTIDMGPGFVEAHLYLGWAYEQKGKFSEAIAELQKALRAPGIRGR